MIPVVVAYALPDQQFELPVHVPEGSTVHDVIECSGILAQCAGLDLAKQSVGINSRVANLGDLVLLGDRVEIYRPLTLSPMEARRLRAQRSQ